MKDHFSQKTASAAGKPEHEQRGWGYTGREEPRADPAGHPWPDQACRDRLRPAEGTAAQPPPPTCSSAAPHCGPAAPSLPRAAPSSDGSGSSRVAARPFSSLATSRHFPPPAAAGRRDAAMLGAGRRAAPLSAARGRPRPALPPPPRGLRSRVRAPPPAPGSPGWGRPKAGGSGVAPRLLLYSLQAFVQVIAASSVLSRALLQVTVRMRLALYRFYPSRNKYSNLTVLGNFEPLISRGSQDP